MSAKFERAQFVRYLGPLLDALRHLGGRALSTWSGISYSDSPQSEPAPSARPLKSQARRGRRTSPLQGTPTSYQPSEVVGGMGGFENVKRPLRGAPERHAVLRHDTCTTEVELGSHLETSN